MLGGKLMPKITKGTTTGDGRNKAAVLLGSEGGKARANRLVVLRREGIARKAAAAR